MRTRLDMKNDEKSKEELLKSLKERDEIISQLKHQIEKLKNNQSDPLTESKYKSILENIEEFYYEIDLAGNFRSAGTPRLRCLG